jgi:fatty acid amide hydrolase 2
MLVNGPLARRAEDLMPVLRLVAGPDGVDPQLTGATLGDPADVSIGGLRVLVSEAANLVPVQREILAAREHAAQALASAGAVVEHIELRKFRLALKSYLTMLSDAGQGTIGETLVLGGASPLTVRRALRRGGDHTWALKLAALAEVSSPQLMSRSTQQAIDWGRNLAAELTAEIGDGVLLHPPFASVAPRHGRTVGRLPLLLPLAIFNLTRLPVTEVPLGLGRKGLPLGVQVVAAPGNDHVSIAVALKLERVFGGWVPPL